MTVANARLAASDAALSASGNDLIAAVATMKAAEDAVEIAKHANAKAIEHASAVRDIEATIAHAKHVRDDADAAVKAAEIELATEGFDAELASAVDAIARALDESVARFDIVDSYDMASDIEAAKSSVMALALDESYAPSYDRRAVALANDDLMVSEENLENAESMLSDAESKLADAQSALDADPEYQAARAAYEQAVAEYDAAQAAYEQAKSALNKAETANPPAAVPVPAGIAVASAPTAAAIASTASVAATPTTQVAEAVEGPLAQTGRTDALPYAVSIACASAAAMAAASAAMRKRESN